MNSRLLPRIGFISGSSGAFENPSRPKPHVWIKPKSSLYLKLIKKANSQLVRVNGPYRLLLLYELKMNALNFLQIHAHSCSSHASSATQYSLSLSRQTYSARLSSLCEATLMFFPGIRQTLRVDSAELKYARWNDFRNISNYVSETLLINYIY